MEAGRRGTMGRNESLLHRDKKQRAPKYIQMLQLRASSFSPIESFLLHLQGNVCNISSCTRPSRPVSKGQAACLPQDGHGVAAVKDRKLTWAFLCSGSGRQKMDLWTTDPSVWCIYNPVNNPVVITYYYQWRTQTDQTKALCDGNKIKS